MTTSPKTEVDPETGWAENWERESGEGGWMLVSTRNHTTMEASGGQEPYSIFALINECRCCGAADPNGER